MDEFLLENNYLQLPKVSQQQIRNKYPFVTSIRNQSLQGFKKYNRKTTKSHVHLLSYMAQFIQEPKPKQIEQCIQLDHYDKILKQNDEHTLCFTLDNNVQNMKLDKQITSNDKKVPINKISSNVDKIQQKVNKKLNEFKQITLKNENKFNVKEKSKLIKEIKEKTSKCLHNFIIGNQKKQIFQYIDTLIKQYQNRVSKLLNQNQQISSRYAIQKDNLTRKYLEQEIELKKISRELQQKKMIIQRSETMLDTIKNSSKQLQNFKNQYQYLLNQFPGMSCSKLIKQYKKLEQCCINKLTQMEGESIRKYEYDILQLKKSCEYFQNENTILKQKIAQLYKECRQNKLMKDMENQQIDNLRKNKQQLKLLQNKIFQVFNNWYHTKTNTEKNIMKELDFFPKDYTYYQMLDYMLFYKSQLSSQQKVGEYLRKILALIQTAKRKIFPNQANIKMDPQKIINLIVQKYQSLKWKLNKNNVVNQDQNKQSNNNQQKYFRN